MSDDAPPDNSYQIALMEQQQAERARQEARDKEARDKAELAALRNSSFENAKGSARRYFSELGLDPEQFGSSIDQRLQDILSSISNTDQNPGSYFRNVGQTIFGDLTSSRQSRLQAELDRIFSPTYETTRIPTTLDDTILADIENEQRSSADAIIRNMVKRGVLTSSGANAAGADLDRQAAGIRGQLREFGDSVLAGGQQKLKDIANQARQTAGTVRLGQEFDPNQFVGNADQVYNDFVASIGDQIRAKVPGNLFKTSGLAAIGGAAQGAGNTKYDPLAAAGVIEDDEEDDTPKKKSSTSTSIF